LVLTHATDRQAFMDELVEHVEHPVPASIVCAIAFGRPSTLIGSITVKSQAP